MISIAVEKWSSRKMSDTLNWLEATYGESDISTWYLEQDYDLFSLVMNDEIHFMYMLTWGE